MEEAYEEAEDQTTSDMQYVVAPSYHKGSNATGTGWRYVGYDIFKITGHRAVGDVVYLLAQRVGWTRESPGDYIQRHYKEPYPADSLDSAPE